MARMPGTEIPTNREGWQPGQAARGRRSRANAAQDLADRRGLVTNVRASHVCVLFGVHGPSLWLANEAVLPTDDTGDASLELIRRAMIALGAVRLEFEELDDGPELTLFTEGFPAQAVGSVRHALGEHLHSFLIEAYGVHELAVRLRVAF